MAPSANLECANCLKTFRSEQMLKTHKRMNSCRKKTFEDMEKENKNLEAAIVIEDDEESVTLAENSMSVEELKRQSAAMVDQVQSYLATEKNQQQPELNLSDKNFTELSSKLSFDYSSSSSSRGEIAKPLPNSLRPNPPHSQFKRPQMLPPVQKTIARKKAVVGMLTGKACSYCNLDFPDFSTLAFHYVREHWEVVREKQSKQWEGSGGRPKSKFHLSGTNGMQEEAFQMTMPTKPIAGTKSTYYPTHRGGNQRSDQASVSQAGPYRPYNSIGPDAAWMRKLEEKKMALSYDERMRRYKEMVSRSNANRKTLPIRPDQPACRICQIVFKTHTNVAQHNMAVHGGNRPMGNRQQQNVPKLTGNGSKTFVDPIFTGNANKNPVDPCEVCDDDFSWPDADHSCAKTEKAKKNLVSKPILATDSATKVDENVTNDPILSNDLVMVVD